MNELKRVLKPGGMLLVTVWAASAVQQQWIPLENKHDYLVPWQSKYNRYYHVFSEEEARALADAMDPMHVQVHFERDNWYVMSRK
jgi:SAM-dependent methyltransferase